jgi:hypothetical protein
MAWLYQRGSQKLEAGIVAHQQYASVGVGKVAHEVQQDIEIPGVDGGFGQDCACKAGASGGYGGGLLRAPRVRSEYSAYRGGDLDEQRAYGRGLVPADFCERAGLVPVYSCRVWLGLAVAHY